MTTINPYLTFNGNCEEAFNFYKDAFGGEFRFIGRFGDMPDENPTPVPEADKNKVMHISLPISKETILMGSDSSAEYGGGNIIGNNITISINCSTNEETDKIFNALSAGGKITMPLNKTFWGSYFGMFTDKFGIHWMASCEGKEHKDFEKEHKR